MRTRIIKINTTETEEIADALQPAVDILMSGGLVAFPTETVYGLGGRADLPESAKAIYAAKGRPSDNPLIVHIGLTNWQNKLAEIASEIPETAYKLANAFWAGALTMILPKSENIPYETTGGLDTVAVRMPSHPVAQVLLNEVCLRAGNGCAVAAPSANTSGRPSPTNARRVIEDLDGKVDCIIDAGSANIGLESTIIDLTEEIPTILRPGYITKEDIENVIGTVQLDAALERQAQSRTADETAVAVSPEPPKTAPAPKAPGMKYKHYAPKGDLYIVEGGAEAVIQTIHKEIEKAEENEEVAAVIATDETKEKYNCKNVFTLGSRKNEEDLARNLFETLRKCDEIGAKKIFSESLNTPKLGISLMNRLTKAAGGKIILAKNIKIGDNT